MFSRTQSKDAPNLERTTSDLLLKTMKELKEVDASVLHGDDHAEILFTISSSLFKL